MNLATLASALREVRDRIAEERERLEALEAEATSLERQLAFEMATNEIQSFTHDGATYFLKPEIYVSPKAGMTEQLCRWLQENDAADLVKPYVHPSTLRAFVKELLQAGPIPDGLSDMLHIHEETKVGIRRSAR